MKEERNNIKTFFEKEKLLDLSGAEQNLVNSLEQTYISNKDSLKVSFKNIIDQWFDKLHILTDFDRTLTTWFDSEWNKRPTLISVLRDNWYLSSEYCRKAQDLFDRYHPIEVSAELDIDYKKSKMEEWWEKHVNLLIEYNLNIKDINQVISYDFLRLRDWAKAMFDFLNRKNVPVVIISAAVLGEESIRNFLEKNNIDTSNIYIISNSFNFDDNWYAISYNQPLIHTFNKDETMVTSFPKIDNVINTRRNVLLFGDSLGDPDMIEGFDYENIIKIGFLNSEVEKYITNYLENYDLIIPNDGDFYSINYMLSFVGN